MPVTALIAPALTPYLSIDGIEAGETYRYKAREDLDENGERVPVHYPVFSCRMHRPKHRSASIVYMAVKAGADVRNLQPGEKLYVGSQTKADRMFRGDGFARATNFHHGDMRSGRRGQNIQTYVRSGGRVDIYLALGEDLLTLAASRPETANLARLLGAQIPFTQPAHLKYKGHAGHWVEQLILRDEHEQWAWNAMGATRTALEAFRIAGI